MDAANIVIKVIGIGVGGCNAINHMIERGLDGVEFIAVDTDEKSLTNSHAAEKLQLGTVENQGQHTYFDAKIGQLAVLEDREAITRLISGADMVILITGLGECSDSGALTVIAQITSELNILSVTLITYPFPYEVNRMGWADEALGELLEDLDMLIAWPNPSPEISDQINITEEFNITDQSMYQFVADVTGAINKEGLINFDFSDLRSLFAKSGLAMTGSAAAIGDHRASTATVRAIKKMTIHGASGVVINITSSYKLKLKEIATAMECVQLAAPNAAILLGSVYDESMADVLRVTVVATGLKTPHDSYSGDSK
jgi:cell division protein FtsZ